MDHNSRFLLPITAAALLLSSCASYHVRQGERSMELLAYSKADAHFEKALDHLDDRDLLLKAARTKVKLNEVEEAAALYARADSAAPLAGDDAFRMGRLLMGQGQYQAAADLLMRAWEDSPDRRDITELIGACQGYLSFFEDSSRFVVERLPLQGLATAFSATPFGQGLLITGQQQAAGSSRDPWSGYSFTDLYTVAPHSAGEQQVQPLKGEVNGRYHEGPAVLSPGDSILYFTRSNYYGRKLYKDEANVSNLKLFRAVRQPNGEWGQISEFSYNSDEYSIGHPALSKDGKTLFFTSDMPGGFGGKDIWYCQDQGTGWSAPVNMGSTINTSGDEMFPTVVGDMLYFSSTAHNNMGGLDIFVTHREGDYWSEPSNMGYPINSPRDDFGLWLDSAGTQGYLSSDRSGVDWIHTLEVLPLDFAVEGTITHAGTGEPIPHAWVTLDQVENRDKTRVQADAQGNYHFNLVPNASYRIVAEADSMLAANAALSTMGLGKSTILRADMKLTPLEFGKPIVIPNIYYDFDKWNIRPDAAAELDKLVELIQDNPTLRFELGSHTDSRGSDPYNLVLSDARANSAVDYLVRHGVDPDRLTSQGYGERQLVNHCKDGVECTEEEHQANRRTEFKVIEKYTPLAPD